jgi:hypothetical protein
VDSGSEARSNEESRAAWNDNAATWDTAREGGIAFQDVLTEPVMLRLLGPVGGPRKTLGLRPDVTAGHRVGAVDEAGRTIHALVDYDLG